MQVKLKIQEFRGLYSAMIDFDKVKSIELPGRTRIIFAMNRDAIHPIIATYERERNAKWKEISPNVVGENGGLDEEIFNALPPDLKEQIGLSVKELLFTEVDVTLQALKMDDLKLDDNTDLTSGMLLVLKPMISDWPSVSDDAAAPN